MLETAKLIAFVATTDGARARDFYEGVLGFVVLSDDPFALTLNVHGTMLRVQKVASFKPLPFTTLGWEIADIAAAVDELRNRGVAFARFPGMVQDERGIWSSPSGARVAWFKDPDGNTLSLTELHP